MTIVLHKSTPRGEGRCFGSVWIIDAPWAHPAWYRYAISLFDLVTRTARPPVVAAVGVTHEVAVFAMSDLGEWMLPANQGYQFAAETDEAAEKRIAGYVEMIERRELSPDIDHRAAWDHHFVDGVSLVVGANKPQNGLYQ